MKEIPVNQSPQDQRRSGFILPIISEGQIASFVSTCEDSSTALIRYKGKFMEKVIRKFVQNPTIFDIMRFQIRSEKLRDIVFFDSIEAGEITCKILSQVNGLTCEFMFTPYYEEDCNIVS